MDPLLFLVPAIFVAGFIDAIAGGGGLITVPAYMIAGLPPLPLLGTNKFVSTLGTLASTGKYIHSGRILWPIAIVGIPCSLLGAAMGAHTVALLEADWVRKIILVMLPIAAILVLLPKPHGHVEREIHWRSPRLWILIPLISTLLGWYDGFFGPGTGTLLILALYGLAGLSLIHAAAVSRLFNLVSNASALVTFIYYGQVLYRFALPLVAASIAGHYLGSHLALKRGHGLVRGMLVVSSGLLFVYLLWKQFL